MRVTKILAGAALALGLASPALAERPRDRVEADSYGNLVVWSSAGYKRIVVKKGHLADELADFVNAGRPTIVRGGDDDDGYDGECLRAPVLLKGRSYMYGLSDGELPVLAGSCISPND
jgi:hypothetical protein